MTDVVNPKNYSERHIRYFVREWWLDVVVLIQLTTSFSSLCRSIRTVGGIHIRIYSFSCIRKMYILGCAHENWVNDTADNVSAAHKQTVSARARAQRTPEQPNESFRTYEFIEGKTYECQVNDTICNIAVRLLSLDLNDTVGPFIYISCLDLS